MPPVDPAGPMPELDAPPADGPSAIEPHWSGLPIFGVEARERGFDIPLPFGTGVVFYREEQPLRVDGLRLSTGSTVIDLDPLLNPSEVDARQWNLAGRVDAWILPFLNVYGIFGYTEGSSSLDLTIPSIGLLPGRTVPVELDYEGPTYGGGITLAGGLAPIPDDDLTVFGVLDANFTVTDLDFTNTVLDSNSEIEAGVASMRLGVRDVLFEHDALGRVTGALWVGAMYQDIAQTIAVGVPGTPFGVEIDQTPQEPWNALVGGRLELGPNVDLLVEVGFLERTSVTVGATWRF